MLGRPKQSFQDGRSSPSREPAPAKAGDDAMGGAFEL